MTLTLMLCPPPHDVFAEVAPARPDADGNNLNWQDPATTDVDAFEPIVILPTPMPAQRALPINRADLTLGVVASKDVSANPLLCDSRDLMSLLDLAYEGLYTMGDTMEPIARLAESYVIGDKDWTVTLRKNVRFNNGWSLTANDVVASYKYIMEHEESPYHASVSLITHMAAGEDGYTITLRGRNSYQLLYAMMFPVVPASEVEYPQPSGSGGFYVEEYQPGTRITLRRNDNWWKRAPEISSISAYLYNSAENALNGLTKGHVDGVISRSLLAGKYRVFSAYTAIDYPTRQFECLIPNHARAPFNDINNRKGIMYALNRTTLASTVYLNMVTESESPVPPSSWLYESQTTKYRFNRDVALSYFAKAGWNDSDMDGVLDKQSASGNTANFKFTLLTYDDPNAPTRSDMAMRIRDQLAPFGIDVVVKVDTYENVQNTLKKGNFDMVLASYSLDPVPDLSYLLASSGRGNYARYDNPEVDALLKEARAESNQLAYQILMSRIQRIAVDELPVLGLYFRTGVLITRDPLPGISSIHETQALRGLDTYRQSR